jgi:hypothetical protein
MQDRVGVAPAFLKIWPLVLALAALFAAAPSAWAATLTYDQALAAYEKHQYAEAKLAFEDLAKTGHAGAQYQLGLMHHQGDGVAPDIREGLRWYRRSADQNFPPALYAIGLLLDQGFGVKENPVEATKHFKRAAELGHPQAQFTYGYMLQQGRGAPKNGPEALKWFHRAAEQGHGIALFGIAICNKRCPNVPPNKAQTHAFLTLAIPILQEGIMKNSAIRMQTATAREMTQAELAQSAKVSADWQAKHPPKTDSASGEPAQAESKASE